MFGTYRYLLAMMVAFGHIHFLLFGQNNWLGTYAVSAFFTLSGYLMTRVLHETYGYAAAGRARFLANRFLRIYPPYWTAALLTAAVFVFYPLAADKAAWQVHLPQSLWQWGRNGVLIGVTRDYAPVLVPVAWSLHIEFIFYILMGLGLSASRTRTGLWALASVGWTCWAIGSGVGFGNRYSTVLGGSLPFSLGALLYFLPASFSARLLRPAVALFFVHAVAAPWLWADLRTGGFYASMLLALASVPALAPVRTAGRWKAVDQYLGDLSYPIFLLHTQVSFTLTSIWPYAFHSQTQLFLATLPVLHVLAVLFHHTVVARIERWRRRLRIRASASSPGPTSPSLQDPSLVPP